MLCQGGPVKSAIVVFLFGDEQKKVGQPLVSDESIQVASVGIGDTGRTSPQHVESGEIAGLAILVDLE